MNSYDEFIELLEKKGHLKALRVAMNFAPLEAIPEEARPNVIRKSVGVFISSLLKSDEEIKKAFNIAACDLIVGKVVEDLDLKKDENFQAPSPDVLFKTIIDALSMNKHFKE